MSLCPFSLFSPRCASLTAALRPSVDPTPAEVSPCPIPTTATCSYTPSATASPGAAPPACVSTRALTSSRLAGGPRLRPHRDWHPFAHSPAHQRGRPRRRRQKPLPQRRRQQHPSHRLPSGPARVLADRRRVTQVLGNLLSNASRHSPFIPPSASASPARSSMSPYPLVRRAEASPPSASSSSSESSPASTATTASAT